MPTPSINPWKFTTSALGLFIVAMGAMWGMVTVHAGHPHDGTVVQREFDAQMRNISGRLERMELKLDAALER